jgi:peptidoglycan hydrolase-like protein with peptidoglycan-binding domain
VPRQAINHAIQLWKKQIFDAMKRFALLSMLVFCSIPDFHADDQIAAVQEKLKSRGFYYGEVDGENNNETAAAITRFQVRSGFQITGELNEETLRSLGLELSQPVGQNEENDSAPKIEAWRALLEQDREFLKQTTASQRSERTTDQFFDASRMDQIRDFVAGFVVAGITSDVEPELQFYADKAEYYDSGLVSKDFIRNDILSYNQKWPVRRYWLEGDVRILNEMEAGSIEVSFQIRYVVRNRQKESRGTAVKTLKLQTKRDGLEITSVREITLK